MTYAPQPGAVPPGYGTPPGYAPVLPPPKRPPLERRARRGALIAGGISFTLWNLGWTILLVLAIGLLVAAFLSSISDNASSGNALKSLIDAFASNLDVGSLTIFLIVIAAAAALIVVFSILISGWILKGHGVASRWGVTWAGLGISLVVNWIVGALLSVIGQAGTLLSQTGSRPDIGRALGAGGIWFGVGLVLEIAIGALTWWWMAYAMRPRTPQISSTPQENN